MASRLYFWIPYQLPGHYGVLALGQNTVAKKRAGHGDVESDYLYGNFLLRRYLHRIYR